MLKLLLITCLALPSIIIGQTSNIEIVKNKTTINNQVNLDIKNNSDSLLCIFFSSFYGGINNTKFEVTMIDSTNNIFLFDFSLSIEDTYYDFTCKPYNVLTIKPYESKNIQVSISKNFMLNKIRFNYIKTNTEEGKFLKRLPKRCLERRYNFLDYEVNLN